MLRAIVELGKYNESIANQPREVYLVLAVELDAEGNYKGISVERFDKSNSKKYLHVKEGNNTRSPGFTPTFVKSWEDIINNPTSTINWFKEGTKKLFGKEVELDASVLRELAIRYKPIKEKGNKKKAEEGDKKEEENILITVKINGKYLDEIDEVREKVKKLKREWLESKKSGIGICASCGEGKDVIGDYFPLTIYTVDNPAYAPNLNKAFAYTHMPICLDCLERAERGVELMRSKLEFDTAGLKYYFLPELIFPVEGFDFAGILKILEDKQAREIDPEDIANYICEETGLENLDWFRVHIIFAKKDRKALRLKAVIEEVFPSRLGYIHKLVKTLNKKLGELPNIRTLTEEVKFSVGNIRKLTPDEPSFFKLLRIAYLGERIDNETLISILLSGLKKSIKNLSHGKLSKSILFAHYGYLMVKVYFFVKLAMEDIKLSMEGELMESVNLTEENLEEFLTQYFEGNETLVGIAIVGKLVRHIERAQYAKGYTVNFFWKLSDLNLTWDGLEELMVELCRKAKKYGLGKNFMEWYSRAMERLRRDRRQNIGRESINFALCVGYALDYKLKGEEVDENEGGQEQDGES